jgi:PBP1b-binding outer membrane lipoprotein LpoB
MKTASSLLLLAALVVGGCEKSDTANPDDATKTETPATDAPVETPTEAPTDAEAPTDEAAAPAEGDAAAAPPA